MVATLPLAAAAFTPVLQDGYKSAVAEAARVGKSLVLIRCALVPPHQLRSAACAP